MAIIAPTDEENQQNQQNQQNGSIVGTTGNVNGRPNVPNPIQSTVTTGGGGLGGTKTPTGPSQAGTPTQSTAPSTNQSGNFTNLQNYLNENPDAGTNLANTVSGAINQQNTGATNAINSGVQQFNTDVNTGTVGLNQNLISSALADPASFAQTPSNVTAFQAQLNPTYTGPTSLQNDYSVYNPISQAVTSAQQYGGQVGTAGGREALLSTLTPAGTNQTQGGLGLNNFFLQSSPDAMQTISNPNINLTGALNDAQTKALDTVSQGQQQTAATGQNVANQVSNAFTGIQNNVNQNVSNLQNQATQNANALKTALATNQQLTSDQIAQLGVTPAQWTALQTLATQYQNDLGVTNNLAMLGAENFAGMPSTALIPTTGAQTTNNGLLSNVLSAGNTATSLAGAGATATQLSNLLTGGPSVAEQAAATAYNSMTPAAQGAYDAAMQAATASGASSMEASQAASAAAYDAMTPSEQVATDTAAEEAGMTVSDYIPYVGAAFQIGMAINNGYWGDGAGGLEGGATGALQGAMIGGAIGGPFGAVVGGIAGFIAGFFTGETPSVGPNGVTVMNVSNGQLTVDPTPHTDNGADPNNTLRVANQAATAINALLKANGLTLSADPGKENNPSNAQGLGIYQGNPGVWNGGGIPTSGPGMIPNSAKGLWAYLVSNNMIKVDPNSTVDTTSPLNMSSYITTQQPSTQITTANTATPEQYANYNALNTLSGQNNQFLTQNNVAQAGTSKPNITGFDYQTALNNLNQDISSYNNLAPTQQQTALKLLQQGLI